MSEEDFPTLVSFFRQASPYITQHWQKTFVIAVPGYIVADARMLDAILADVTLLHGLGARIVLVAGASAAISDGLRREGLSEHFVSGYRVTDAAALAVAKQVAGATRIEIESKLSKAVPVGTARRHGYGANSPRPFLEVVSGNFVIAKRRGVVHGVDFEHTGDVRGVWEQALTDHLAQGHLVMLNNLGYTDSGEVLNCNCHDVARAACKALAADKLLVYHGQAISKLGLPAWIRLSEQPDAKGSASNGAGVARHVNGDGARAGHQSPNLNPLEFAPKGSNPPFDRLGLDLSQAADRGMDDNALAEVSARVRR